MTEKKDRAARRLAKHISEINEALGALTRTRDRLKKEWAATACPYEIGAVISCSNPSYYTGEPMRVKNLFAGVSGFSGIMTWVIDGVILDGSGSETSFHVRITEEQDKEYRAKWAEKPCPF